MAPCPLVGTSRAVKHVALPALAAGPDGPDQTVLGWSGLPLGCNLLVATNAGGVPEGHPSSTTRRLCLFEA